MPKLPGWACARPSGRPRNGSPCLLRLGGFHGPHVFRVSHQSTPGCPLAHMPGRHGFFVSPARRRMEVTTPNENGPPPPAAEAEQNAADKAARAADAVVEEVAAVSADLTRASDDATRHEVETTRDTLQAGLNTAAQAFECAADQVTKVVGLTGPRAEELARRSSETFEAVAQASAVLARTVAASAAVI